LGELPLLQPLLEDPNLPPPPDLLLAKPEAAFIVVTWCMQTSTESLTGVVDAIGAYCPFDKFDKNGEFSSRVLIKGGLPVQG